MAMVGRMGAPSSAGRGAMQMPPVSAEKPQTSQGSENVAWNFKRAFFLEYLKHLCDVNRLK